ncbi:MAG: Maf family protein [Planctomycetota bacterium]
MLFLASSSPRRQELLRAANLDYQLITPGPEVEGSGVPIELAVQRAHSKALGAPWAPELGAGFVLGSDTVVELGGVEFGKAADRAEALRMLLQLGGFEHQVHTAFALVERPSGRVVEGVVTSRVSLPSREPSELMAWLDSGGWRGKAGAYGLQDPECAATLIAGDRNAVIGLPVEAVCVALEQCRRGLGGNPS